MNDLIHRLKELRARLVPMGACHACGQPLRHANGVFCDDECARDRLDDENRATQKEPTP